MAIHRATTTSGSVAEARFRTDAQPVHHYHPDYHACDTSMYSNLTSTQRPRQVVLEPAPDRPQNVYPHPSTPSSNDPTQPLLPIPRFQTYSRFPSLPMPSSQPSPSGDPASSTPYEALPYDSDHYRMTAKSSSGTYIGLLCIVIVWLLPIGIIISGGTGGDIATRASALLGRPAQMLVQGENPLQPLIWQNLKRGEHCLRYKTREYTAKSIGTIRGQAGVEECRRSQAQIHDVALRPTFCEDLGIWSGIWGHWVIDFEEPDCETSWTEFQDQGCQAVTGRHRFTAKLDRLNRGDNWLIMCSTTPPEYALHGKPLSVPSRCERIRDAVIGIWDVPDRSCESPSTPR